MSAIGSCTDQPQLHIWGWKADIQRLGILWELSAFRLFNQINNSAFSIRPTRAVLNGHGEQTLDFDQICNLVADVLKMV